MQLEKKKKPINVNLNKWMCCRETASKTDKCFLVDQPESMEGSPSWVEMK